MPAAGHVEPGQRPRAGDPRALQGDAARGSAPLHFTRDGFFTLRGEIRFITAVVFRPDGAVGGCARHVADRRLRLEDFTILIFASATRFSGFSIIFSYFASRAAMASLMTFGTLEC